MKMAKSDRKAVDKYIASQPKAVQTRLTRVRSTIRKAVPGAEETICVPGSPPSSSTAVQ